MRIPLHAKAQILERIDSDQPAHQRKHVISEGQSVSARVRRICYLRQGNGSTKARSRSLNFGQALVREVLHYCTSVDVEMSISGSSEDPPHTTIANHGAPTSRWRPKPRARRFCNLAAAACIASTRICAMRVISVDCERDKRRIPHVERRTNYETVSFVFLGEKTSCASREMFQ